MKKNLIILILTVSLFFSIFLNMEKEKKYFNIEVKKEDKKNIISYIIENKKEKIKKKFTNIKNLEVFNIYRVIDGDTIKIKNKIEDIFTVRIIGINTPETVHPTKKIECFGKEATEMAKIILSGQKIYLDKDLTQGVLDKYGRKLGYIILENGEDFGEIMIKNGLAYEYTYNLPYKKQKIYKNAENFARKNKKGLWKDGACENFSIKDFFKKNIKGCNIKGNISSSTKEKIYHIPGQRYYVRTKISEEIGEKFFCSESEAVSEGWRKSKI